MRILAAGLVVAGRDGDLSMRRSARGMEQPWRGLFTGWVPASAAVAVHLPIRAGVGAI